MEFHETANIFPMLTGDEYRALRDDIAANGQLEAIWTYQGKILDGRNRYAACLELGIEPECREWVGYDPLSFVLSMNLHRRHLNETQRAIVASKIANMQQGGTGSNQYQSRSANLQVSIPNAAKMMNVSERTVASVKAIERDAPELLPKMEAGTMRVSQAIKQINNPVLYSSETDEWYTPWLIVERVQKVFGEIELDPCSNSKDQPSVPAVMHFTKEDNGLTLAWFGRVYMNPPYGREIKEWVEYLVSEFEAGNTKEAIALVPSRTDTEWFRLLKDFPRCFIWGRLNFSNNGSGAPFPSMAVYLGDNIGGFKEAFGDIGDIYARI
jgi:hypothetical protein